MSKNEDIRWHQRLANYNKALNKLTEVVNFIVKNIDKKKLMTFLPK